MFAVGFEYVIDGMRFEEVSFTQSWSAPFVPNAQVDVEYVLSRPHLARIAGMRFAEHSALVVWVLLLPLISLVLLVPRCRAAADQIRLLREGAVTHASLNEKRTGGADGGINAVFFEFTLPPDGALLKTGFSPLKYQVAYYDTDTSSVEDEVWEPVLYLPDNPSVNVLVDSLPFTLSADGEWVAPCSLSWALLGPVLFVLINGFSAASYAP